MRDTLGQLGIRPHTSEELVELGEKGSWVAPGVWRFKPEVNKSALRSRLRSSSKRLEEEEEPSGDDVA